MRKLRPMLLEETTVTNVLDTTFGAYERHVLRRYVLAALRPEKGKSRVRVSLDFLDWHRSNRRGLGIEIGALDAAIAEKKSARSFADEVSLSIPRAEIDLAQRTTPAKSALQKRLDWIASSLQLPTREADVLGAVVRLTRIEPFQEFREAWGNDPGNSEEINVRMLARFCDLRRADAASLCGPSGVLRQLGLIEDRHGGDFAPSKMILKVLGQRSANPGVLTSALLGRAVPSSLKLEDFRHLGEAGRRCLDIVEGAISAKEKGAGVLFYGPPGTGKTEFARLMGQALGAHIVFIGEMGEDEPEPSRADRMAHLALLSSLADRAGRVVLVIDEADDIFTGIDDEEFSNRSGSKVFMNRIVENCPVPTIWISNFPARLGQSVVRRMLHAVEFREPDRATRRRIVARHAEAQSVKLGDEEAEAFAALSAPPAVIEAGLRAARLATGDGALALASSRSLLKAMGRVQPVPAPPGATPFDAALSAADADLVELEAKVAAAGPGALSFLFSGLPGTGKSAFARHLAGRLGLEVLEKRGSDLLGMYVGETEKRIAESFEEAADRRLFLIFDEADSLLADRRGAHQTWEVSQVNEMLTWMERHPYPFAATTNLATRLDPATQRRFLFKVRFGAMTGEQAADAFRRAFGVDAPLLVTQLSPLTPGDFAVVARKAKILEVSNPSALSRMLEAEVAAKPDGARRIGF